MYDLNNAHNNLKSWHQNITCCIDIRRDLSLKPSNPLFILIEVISLVLFGSTALLKRRIQLPDTLAVDPVVMAYKSGGS